jgi:hypothetical protein
MNANIAEFQVEPVLLASERQSEGLKKLVAKREKVCLKGLLRILGFV